MLKDCKGRDILQGDKVVFTVGTDLVTGIAEFVGIQKRIYGSSYDAVKVKLDIPLDKGYRRNYAKDENGFFVPDGNGGFVYTEEKRKDLLHRTVYEAYRILIVERDGVVPPLEDVRE